MVSYFFQMSRLRSDYVLVPRIAKGFVKVDSETSFQFLEDPCTRPVNRPAG